MKIQSNMEIDFYVKNECLSILVPLIIENMTTQMPDWPIPVSVGLSMGPTLGQLYEFKYMDKDKNYAIIGPDMEPVKPKVKEELKQEVVEEEIKIEL